MKITADSHTDHALTAAHIAFIESQFAAAEGFAIVTVDLPEYLPALPCALHGPATGGSVVSDDDAYFKVRGERKGASRMTTRAPVLSRQLTVIHGAHNGETILFTAYAGPRAPREPWDESLSPEQVEESRAFWSQHALSEVQS